MTMSAEELAEAVGGPTTPFDPARGELSTLFHWFEQNDSLSVIARDPFMNAQATDVPRRWVHPNRRRAGDAPSPVGSAA